MEEGEVGVEEEGFLGLGLGERERARSWEGGWERWGSSAGPWRSMTSLVISCCNWVWFASSSAILSSSTSDAEAASLSTEAMAGK